MSDDGPSPTLPKWVEGSRDQFRVQDLVVQGSGLTMYGVVYGFGVLCSKWFRYDGCCAEMFLKG